MANQPNRPFDLDQYTVALICPLEKEMSAARYMLDEKHGRVHGTGNDRNQYIIGKLSGHNVVIASLPMNTIGTVSAAIVAARMEQTFRSIRLRLLVGIGGGVPREGQDIRLGDVVVSAPSGTSGGVVQYNLGAETQTGFERRGYLCPVPPEWLHAATQMRMEHRISGNKIPQFIETMLQKFPSLVEYQRPPAEKDILFESTYEHILGQGSCSKCDITQATTRNPRPGAFPNSPAIFYGLIASGDSVIRNVTERDRISRSVGGPICFEMEATGLMGDYNCIVIRGICDYSDSHKNDEWQNYAAAAAAGLAKEILTYMEISLGRDPLWFTPFNREPEQNIIGRTAELNKLTDLISIRSRNSHTVVVVHGEQGCGKSSLALEYCRRHHKEYPSGIFWVVATNAFRIEAEYRRIHDVLSMMPNTPSYTEATQTVKTYFERTRGWLIVFDGGGPLDYLQSIKYLLPAGSGGKVIITTSDCRYSEKLDLGVGAQNLQLDHPGWIDIKDLSRAQQNMLNGHDVDPKDRRNLSHLFNIVSRHCKEKSDTQVYLTSLSMFPTNDHSLPPAISCFLDEMKTSEPDKWSLLRSLSFLDLVIDRSALKTLIKHATELETLRNDHKLVTALSSLEDLGLLLTNTPDATYMHSAVQRWVREKMNVDRELAHWHGLVIHGIGMVHYGRMIPGFRDYRIVSQVVMIQGNYLETKGVDPQTAGVMDLLPQAIPMTWYTYRSSAQDVWRHLARLWRPGIRHFNK